MISIGEKTLTVPSFSGGRGGNFTEETLKRTCRQRRIIESIHAADVKVKDSKYLFDVLAGLTLDSSFAYFPT